MPSERVLFGGAVKEIEERRASNAGLVKKIISEHPELSGVFGIIDRPVSTTDFNKMFEQGQEPDGLIINNPQKQAQMIQFASELINHTKKTDTKVSLNFGTAVSKSTGIVEATGVMPTIIEPSFIRDYQGITNSYLIVDWLDQKLTIRFYFRDLLIGFEKGKEND